MLNIHLLIALFDTLLFNGVIGVAGFASAILSFFLHYYCLIISNMYRIFIQIYARLLH